MTKCGDQISSSITSEYEQYHTIDLDMATPTPPFWNCWRCRTFENDGRRDAQNRSVNKRFQFNGIVALLRQLPFSVKSGGSTWKCRFASSDTQLSVSHFFLFFPPPPHLSQPNQQDEWGVFFHGSLMKGTLENVQSSLELKCPQMVDEEKTEVNAYFMLFRKKLVGIQLHNLKEDFMQYVE